VIGISRRRFLRAITQRKFGGPEVLEIRNVDRPTGLPTEMIVDVRAVGLNRIDDDVRSGASPLLGQPPFTLGWDISGVVDEVVPGVNRFKVGDEIYGMPLFPRPASAYAEYVAAPSRQLALKPAALDHVHAAATCPTPPAAPWISTRWPARTSATSSSSNRTTVDSRN
jgi:NADPH:quinone reductase-like Zn-dependent oxidoreductase